jgi:hypothetical protein
MIAARAKANAGQRTDLPQKSAEGFHPIETREEIAKLAGVSRDTVLSHPRQRARGGGGSTSTNW